MSSSAYDDKKVSKAVAADPAVRTRRRARRPRACPARDRRAGAGGSPGWMSLAIVFMLGLLAFAVIPMAWMFSTSLKSQFAAIQHRRAGSRRSRPSMPTEPALARERDRRAVPPLLPE